MRCPHTEEGVDGAQHSLGLGGRQRALGGEDPDAGVVRQGSEWHKGHGRMIARSTARPSAAPGGMGGSLAGKLCRMMTLSLEASRSVSVRLFVGNLDYSVNEAELRQHFGEVGAPAQVALPVDRRTGRPRGFAFVEFADRAVAEEVIRRFNGQALRGRPLAISEARARRWPRWQGVPPRPPFAGAADGWPTPGATWLRRSSGRRWRVSVPGRSGRWSRDARPAAGQGEGQAGAPRPPRAHPRAVGRSSHGHRGHGRREDVGIDFDNPAAGEPGEDPRTTTPDATPWNT